MAISTTGSATFTINPPAQSIDSSTFATGSFIITNNSENGQTINKVVIDLSSSIFKDMVFDPDGLAGDLAAKGFLVDSLGNTGQTTFNYLNSHDNGYFGLEINFADFQPRETITFSIDVDPTSVKGLKAPGPGKSASVSGLELVGSTVTVYFNDDTSATGQLYYIPNSTDGSTTNIQSDLPDAPSLEILGIPSESTTSGANQTIRITGTPGANVSLLLTEGALFTKDGEGFDLDAFEANSAVTVNEKTAVIGSEGYVDVTVILTHTTVTDGESGLNILTAVTKGKNGVNSFISNVAVVEYVPNITDTDTNADINAIRINAGGKKFIDTEGNVWSADKYFVGGKAYQNSSEIDNTTDDSLYNSERSLLNNDDRFSYQVPVDNGNYNVTLKFAEIYFENSGKRVFDAFAEGEQIIDDLDIVAQAGGNKLAFDRTFNVKVEDGVLDLDFVSNIQNAKLSAIEIVPISKPVDPVDPVEPEEPAKPQAIRINAGGKKFIDTEGNVWSADKYFVGGRAYRNSSEIDNTTDDSLYNSERSLLKNDDRFSYQVPVDNGNYNVTLKFAEIYFENSGKRVFDAFAEGEQIIDDLDIVAQAGGNKLAFDRTFNVKVEDGVLDLDFVSNIQNAKLSAIEIVPISKPVDPVDPVDPPVDPNQPVAIRINAGGKKFTDAEGNVWSADQYFSGGNAKHTNDPIFRTELDTIYQFNRSAQDLAYDIPVNNGFYSVNLHFTETYWEAPLKRAFDVSLEGKEVIQNLDLFAATKNAFDPGHDTAYVASFPQVQITDGVLDLDFSANVNQALIAGIEIIPLSGAQVVLQESQDSTVVQENGNGDSYNLTLTKKPSSNVVVNINPSNLLNTFASQVIFTPENWNTSQTILVNAIDNNQATGIKFSSISHSVVSSDVNYNGYELPNLSVEILDDEVVPIKFIQKTVATNVDPYRVYSPYAGVTVGAWGPDDRLYVGSYSGVINVYTFDENYNVIDTEVINTVAAQSNPSILGIAFNPFDTSDNPQIYVSHSQLYANGGHAFPGTELSPYSGQISILKGDNFSELNPLITGLPVSNHDHGVNDLIFDNQGDLYFAIGSNTNAGIVDNKIGGIPESPLTTAILKAEITKPNFNGKVKYELVTEIDPDKYDSLNSDFNPETDLTFDPATSQVFGDIAAVVPGVDVSVYASGLRNTFSLLLTTDNLIYGVDNGANGGLGDVSTSATTQEPFQDKRHLDELNLIEEGNYYGFANRSRGLFDDRQNVYHGPDEASTSEYTAPLTTLSSSTNGLDEYRANSFGGQLKGDLLVQRYKGRTAAISLSDDGRVVESKLNLEGLIYGLDVFTAPRGAIVGVDYINNSVTVALPDDASIGNVPTALDIFPWRAPATGGNLFIIGGDNFGDLSNTSVTIGGEIAQISSVSDGLIRGFFPAFNNPSSDLLDVVVESAGQISVLDDAFLALA